MRPSPPGRFSTAIAWPVRLESRSANTRPATSVAAPAEFATTRRTDFVGQDWAETADAKKKPASRPARREAKAVTGMGGSLKQRRILRVTRQQSDTKQAWNCASAR